MKILLIPALIASLLLGGIYVQQGGPWTTTATIQSNATVDLNKVAGNAVATAASGIAKVGLTDASGNNITSSTNALDVNLKTSNLSNQSVNQTQINGSAVVTSATGVQKVGIVGATGTTMDAATAGVLDVNVKNWNNVASLSTASVGSNVVAFEAWRAGTTRLAPNYSASHITTNTTTTPTAATAYISTIAICVTNAGTTWTLNIQDKGGTPKIIYTSAAVAIGNTYIQFPAPVLFTSGIDIVTGGTTAGVMDVFITYWQ